MQPSRKPGERIPGLFRSLFWFLLFSIACSSAIAAPRGVATELRLTDTILADAIQAAGTRPSAQVADLLDNARERQAEARRRWELGQSGRARLGTRVARRLAQRALAALHPMPDQPLQLERQLQRADRRLAAVRGWLDRRPAHVRLQRRVAAAGRDLDEAWRAYRENRYDDSVKRLGSLRQLFRDVESRGFVFEIRP